MEWCDSGSLWPRVFLLFLTLLGADYRSCRLLNPTRRSPGRRRAGQIPHGMTGLFALNGTGGQKLLRAKAHAVGMRSFFHDDESKPFIQVARGVRPQHCQIQRRACLPRRAPTHPYIALSLLVLDRNTVDVAAVPGYSARVIEVIQYDGLTRRFGGEQNRHLVLPKLPLQRVWGSNRNVVQVQAVAVRAHIVQHTFDVHKWATPLICIDLADIYRRTGGSSYTRRTRVLIRA